MELNKLIPKLAKKISIYDFSSNEYFIHQEDYDHRIKISSETYDLIKKIDGKKTLEQLNKELNDSTNIDFLYNLLYTKLGKYGIIENNFIKIKPNEKPSYLKLSFIVIPSNFISKITPSLKFLFYPRVLKFLISLCFTIIIFTVITNYNDILKQNFGEINWIMFFCLSFLSVTFHEFGHVTATEYFGAKQDGIGGGFYLFSPVYFADVTDIWKLKPNQRIIVNLAGIYFELLICTIYIILALSFNFKFLMIFASVIFLRTLINLNPFLRSDGYWVLTDKLGIPNLRKVSANLLLAFIKSIINKKQKFIYSKKNILLTLYASVNYLVLIMFISYVIIFNSNSVLYFPKNLYNFIKGIINGNDLTLINLSVFIIPLLFYYLLFSLLKNLITKKWKKKL
jgi:putative peptide zinc metalloprotease protein|tara:strand:- start:1242 stop:2429 length:1188 start_codon:yes stop_codon:yes gene_type:complete